MMTAGRVSDDPSVDQFRSIFSDVIKSEVGEPETEKGGVMVQCVNHATGQNSWKMMPSDYDYNQELARAAFADMLHDSERNRLYYEGLAAAIMDRSPVPVPMSSTSTRSPASLLSLMAAARPS